MTLHFKLVDDVDWAFIYVLLVLFVSIATSTAYDYYLKNHSIASTPESREKSNHYRNNVKGKCEHNFSLQLNSN